MDMKLSTPSLGITHHEELARTEIPARGPRGSDVNFERVKAIGRALLAKRLALRSAT